MAKHQPDLLMCLNQPGIAIGRLCEVHDGHCVCCDSLVQMQTLARLCDNCHYGSGHGQCVICSRVGISDAYYCKQCIALEKDRTGCPKIIVMGSTRKSKHYLSHKR